MFVFNVKLNKKTIFKVALGCMCFTALLMLVFATYKILNKMNNSQDNNLINDIIPSSEVAQILPQNYTNILKAVHDDLDKYVGQKIAFSGYIYRLNGFNEDQFVLARDMDIGNNQTLVVGFLCTSEKAKDFPSYTWVNITGEITKGNYNGEIPLIKITAIEKAQKPENSSVSVPDSSYVPTAVIY